MAERIFVYGTLHPDCAPREIADLVRRFRPLGEGRVRGRLYDLGDFPAVVLDGRSKEIKGEVFVVPRDADALARLDAFEEYSPDAPQRSLFLRRKTNVTLNDGSLSECWIYVYNQQVPAHPSGLELSAA